MASGEPMAPVTRPQDAWPVATDGVKAGLALLQRQRQSPAVLAETLGLVGCYASAEGPGQPGSGARDPRALKQTLRQRQQAQRIGT